MQDDNNKNVIIATALSFGIMLVWLTFFAPDAPPPPAQEEQVTQEQPLAPQATGPQATGPQATGPQIADGTQTSEPSAQVLAEATPEVEARRIAINNDRLEGTISLKGGRIDELSLKDYRTSTDADAPIVDLLSPIGSDQPYYAIYGWASGAGLDPQDVPGVDTIWATDGDGALAPGEPLVLRWTNDKGITFVREISIDEDYMFSVAQSVVNGSDSQISLAPYGTVARHGEPQDLKSFFILHEGLIRMSDGVLDEIDYDDIADLSSATENDSGSIQYRLEQDGWIGFTDHYWMTVLVPQEAQGWRTSAQLNQRSEIYQASLVGPTQTLAAGASVSVTTQLFAGAKEWEAIRNYESGEKINSFSGSVSYMFFGEEAGIKGLLDSIDWGWFFFLTKPIFFMLHELNLVIGNMGWSIIALTLIIKAILLPLAYKSYVSMAKMKELQPEMLKLKEKAGDDRQALQKGMMELYKKEKVNPASGCLPILLQIPIFFSLYKVIFVTLELRHAPWFGPFNDLAAPDPTSIINLFGWLPFAGPEPETILALVFLGILPILLGISMWLQQKLNPAPTDPTQAMIFAWMPWVFMFMLGSFASGLVVYWIANNVITFTQQYFIMRSQGVNPDVLGNIRSGISGLLNKNKEK